MADLTLPTELVEHLDAIARREKRTVESLIESLLKEHIADIPGQDTSDNLEKREALLKEDRLKVYEMARRYWRNSGDLRQNMTDDEMEADFWLIDEDGIPRLKSEKNPPDMPKKHLQTILTAIPL